MRPPTRAPDDDKLVFAGGVHSSGKGAYFDTHCAADERKERGLGEELDTDAAFGSAEDAGQIMMLATPTASTRRATAPRPGKRASKAPWASACVTRATEGCETSTSPWVLRPSRASWCCLGRRRCPPFEAGRDLPAAG
jgi:hypothetical protein